MIRRVRHIIAFLADRLGIGFMSREFLTFVRMHGFFALGIGLSGMFIGAFMLKAGSSAATVGMFYLIAFGAEGILYFIMAWLWGKLSPTKLSRIGLVFYASSYLFLLIFRDAAGTVFPITAILSALGASFYWLPYHIYNVKYTKPGNRQLSMSMMGMVVNLIMLTTPVISGSVIFFLPGMYGYAAIFIISILSFSLAAFITRKMPSEPTGHGGNALISLFRHEMGDPLVSSLAWAHFFFGIRDGMFMFYLNLLIFTTTSNEFIMGMNNTLRSVIVIALYAVIARHNTSKIRRGGVWVAGLAAVCITLGVSLWFSAFTVIALSLTDAAMQSFQNNTMQYASYSVSDYLSEKSGTERRNEVIAMRSSALNAGRVVGIAVSLLLPAGFGSPATVLLILSALSLPAAFFLSRIEKLRGFGE